LWCLRQEPLAPMFQALLFGNEPPSAPLSRQLRADTLWIISLSFFAAV
jgi:hypothetical protein